MTREWYGRGEYVELTAGQIMFAEFMAKHLNETPHRPWPLIEPGFWLPKRVEDFTRSALADAVASAVSA
jgi:hypothetical protein